METEKKSAKINILQVAMKMFAKNGYHKTSTAEICKKAKISSGLLFYHFGTKRELLDATIDLILLKVDLIINQKPSLTPREELENIIDVFFKSLKDERPFWDLYMALLYQPDTKELILNKVLEHSKNFRRKVYELMKEMGYKNPNSESFEFEIFRVGVFASYLSNHNEILLKKASNIMKTKYITNLI